MEGKLGGHRDCVITSMHSEPNWYLLDLPVCGDRSLHVALLLEPGTDSLKGSVSTAPAVVVNVVLHVVVVTVDASDQGHLEKTHLGVLSKTALRPLKRGIGLSCVCMCNLTHLSLVQRGMCEDTVRVSEVAIFVSLVGKSVGTHSSEIGPVFR